MNTQYLETFIQAAAGSSFTRAARDLNYSQSTVTMHIQRLEEELGFALFEKIGRKNYLTSAGEAFLPTAMEITAALRKAESLGKDPAEMEGILRIGVLESLAFAFIVDLLPRFRKVYPGVNVQLKIGSASELLDHLRQNNLDLIYISFAPVTDDMFICCHMRREGICFVAGKNHPLRNRELIPLSELFSRPFVIAEPSGYISTRLNELSAEHGFRLQVSLHADNLNILSRFLENSDNLSFFPRYYAEMPDMASRLAILRPDLPEQFYYSQLLYHKNKWVTPYMNYFIELIKEVHPQNMPLPESPPGPAGGSGGGFAGGFAEGSAGDSAGKGR